MSIDKLPKIANKLGFYVGIFAGKYDRDVKENAGFHAAFVSLDSGHAGQLESDECKTVQAALESLLAKFEEIGR